MAGSYYKKRADDRDWPETVTMKSFAVLCLLALALSPVWPKSVPETDESLAEREDEFDVTDLSADELKQFIDDARTGLKRAVGKL